MSDEPNQYSRYSDPIIERDILEVDRLLKSSEQYPSPESVRVFKDSETSEKKPREWKTPKILAFLDNQAIDVMDDFFRTFWAEIKALKLLRVALRRGIVIPIVFVWIFTVVQLFGLISDFDVWEPIAD